MHMRLPGPGKGGDCESGAGRAGAAAGGPVPAPAGWRGGLIVNKNLIFFYSLRDFL